MDGLTPSKPKSPTGAAAEKLLEEARDRFSLVLAADRENKDAAKEDTEFVYISGKQWFDKDRKSRRDNGEACLEFPQLKQFVNQVVNDQRQNRPGIRIHPAGGKSSKDVAQILQGLIRGIEYESQAEAAYDVGFQHAVVGGRGYWRVGTAYESPTSFNQKCQIQRIADPNTVWLDPEYLEPDGSDRNFAFVTERIKREDFKARWPDAEQVSWNPDGTVGSWYEDDEVIVADYYRRVSEKATLVQLSNGAALFEDEIKPGMFPPEVTVVQERETTRFRVEWHKIAGGEQILETYEWAGTKIPVICVPGDEIIVDGKRVFQGLIRQARDAQRMYNYEQSAKVMRYALAPKAPFIAAAESIEGHEEQWRQANTVPYSTLTYNAFAEDGETALPMPQRIQPANMESAWIEAAQQSKQDLKSVIGMYENSLGLHGSETSGRAIMAREKQGDNATFHFVDNLSRAIALTGRIIVELIPKYYDTERIVTIVGTDDSRSMQTVNQKVPAGVDPTTGAVTHIVQNDITIGEYAVTVEAGPSFATKRQEMNETMLSLVQSFPQMMQFAGDMVVGSMDFPDADKLAERFKFMLPPPVQQALQAEAQGQDPQMAQMASQMQQVQQQAQQITEQAQKAMQGMQGQLQQTMQENEALKSQLKNKDADAQAKMAAVQVDSGRLALDNKALILETLTEWMKIQQAQMQPVPIEAQGFAPAVQGI